MTHCKPSAPKIEQQACVRVRFFRSQKCRRADFKLRHAYETQLDAEGEVLVRRLEDCPRRLKLARLGRGVPPGSAGHGQDAKLACRPLRN